MNDARSIIRCVVAAIAVAACRRRTHALFAQSLSYTSGQPVSPAFEGWEAGSGWLEVLRVRLHEQELGGGAGRPDRAGEQLCAWRCRSRTADPLPAAPQPVRLSSVACPKGFTEKDELVWTLTTQRQDDQGLRIASHRLPDRRHRQGVRNRRARRRHEQSHDSLQQAPDRRIGAEEP